MNASEFQNIARAFWPGFKWHPWAVRMNQVCHEHPTTKEPYPHVALSGCSMSSKTEYMALYGVINWMIDPLNTLVLACGTDLKSMEYRLWGTILKYHDLLSVAYPCDKARGIIHGHDDEITRPGIVCVACNPSNRERALSILIGSSRRRVIVLMDEGDALPPDLFDAAFNAVSANPQFQFIAAANFKSRDDSFGRFAEPKDGWDNVGVDDSEWETKRGWCLHFDGVKSPNVLTGREKWPIYGSKQLERHRKDLGEKSQMFWRMARSFELR